jgi:large subunit ribosomal protein L22
MKVKATAKFVGTSTRKIGLVAAMIRGMDVTSAQTVLVNANKRATDPVGKVLKSALANAQNNQSLKRGELVVESVLVGPGPTLKRFRPRARGAAGSIKKRTSHITVILTDNAGTTSNPVAAVTPKELPKSQDSKPATKPAATAKPTKPEAEKK